MYEKAAALGDAAAMFNLGVLYENGRGVQRDLSEARRWFEKAAEAGDVTAMRNPLGSALPVLVPEAPAHTAPGTLARSFRAAIRSG